MTQAKAWKHAILLAIILCVFVSQSLAPDRGVLWPMVHDALVTVAVLSVFLVVFEWRTDRIVAVAAAVIAIVCNWARYALPSGGGTAIGVAHDFALALFFSFAVVEILRGIFRQRAIRADDVLGSVCGYLLAGAAWASLHSLVDYLAPASFTLNESVGAQLDGWHTRHAVFDYFSLVTLSTMGYGDVTPIRAPALTLSWMEAVFGQFYIAIVVAQLVAARLAQSLRSGNHDSR